MAHVKVVYHVDVLSSWCLIAEDAVARIARDFGPQIDIEWRIAALRHPLGYTREQLAWYYWRTESVTGVRLNPAWLEGKQDGTRYANLAAEAARSLGCADDRVRLALARSTMIDGKRGCTRDGALAIAAQAGSLDPSELSKKMDDPATEARIAKAAEAFAAEGLDLRPTFVLTNGIGDKTVLSGCWRADVLASCIRALLDDERGYETFVAANPPPQGAH